MSALAAPDTSHAYDHVAGIYLPIAIAVFAIVVGTLLVFLVLGARRREAATRSEGTRLEVSYAAGLVVVVAVLVWITFTAESPEDRVVARPGLRLQVSAAQWTWRFRYPSGRTVTVVAGRGPALELPTHTEIEVDARSVDVIHGFWIPSLHFMRQAFPGHTTRFDLILHRPGRFRGACSVFCGYAHSEMGFIVRAVPPARFRAWLGAGT